MKGSYLVDQKFNKKKKEKRVLRIRRIGKCFDGFEKFASSQKKKKNMTFSINFPHTHH